MAMIRKDYQAEYKGLILWSSSKEDMHFLYWEENLTTSQIKNVFGGKLSRRTIVRRLSELGVEPKDMKGNTNPMWTGGKKSGKGGYILIHKPDHPHSNSQGYVSEHRLVMEEYLGRYLTPEEIVHHIDKDRKNNSIENLQLMKDNSSHAKLENNFRKRDSLGRYV